MSLGRSNRIFRGRWGKGRPRDVLMFFLHCMLNILRHEKIFCDSDESIASLHDPSSDVIFLGVHSESIFHVMEYFFLKKTVFPLVSLSLAYR